jgi:hypothetical protein
MKKHVTTPGVSRRRGGQELPDAVQDRPEQNAGYDAAVRGEGSGSPIESRDDASVISLERGARDAELTIQDDEDDANQDVDDESGR